LLFLIIPAELKYMLFNNLLFWVFNKFHIKRGKLNKLKIKII
jgi:hypothetical protein